MGLFRRKARNVDTDQHQAGFRIDQLREAERTIGRLEAERDQAARERDALRAELTAAY